MTEESLRCVWKIFRRENYDEKNDDWRDDPMVDYSPSWDDNYDPAIPLRLRIEEWDFRAADIAFDEASQTLIISDSSEVYHLSPCDFFNSAYFFTLRYSPDHDTPFRWIAVRG